MAVIHLMSVEMLVRCLCVLAPISCRDQRSLLCQEEEQQNCFCVAGDETPTCLPPKYFDDGDGRRCDKVVQRALTTKKFGEEELAEAVQRFKATAPEGHKWVGAGPPPTAPPVHYEPPSVFPFPSPTTTTTEASLLDRPLLVEGE
jgi:hypothetical protein